MIDDRISRYPTHNPADGSPALVVAPGALPRISWGAVFAGVVMALAVHLLLTMLGAGIGLSTIDPAQYESPSAQTLSFGAGLWWQLSSMVSLFAGGWTAGRLAGLSREKDSLLHGLLTWGVTTLISAYLVTSLLGALLGATGSVLGGAARGAGQAVSAVAPELADQAQQELRQRGVDLEALKREALTALRQTGKPALQPEAIENRAQQAAEQTVAGAQDAARNPQMADQEFGALFDRLFREGQAVSAQADRDALINVVAARTGASREEAAATVARWEQQYQQAKAKLAEQTEQLKAQAREAADKTASALAKTSLWGFLALVLGAIAAAFGATTGRPRNPATA